MKCLPTGTVLCLTATLLAPSAALAGNWLESGLEAMSAVTSGTEQTSEPKAQAPVAQELVNLAMQQLKLTQPQAENSLGGLFQLAKENLNTSDYSQVSDAVPGIDALVALAPTLQQDDSLLGGLLAQAGDAGKALQGANYMKTILDEYGIPLEQLMPLVELASGYLKQNGGADVSSLFNQALSI